jgi:hypothetical protein
MTSRRLTFSLPFWRLLNSQPSRGIEPRPGTWLDALALAVADEAAEHEGLAVAADDLVELEAALGGGDAEGRAGVGDVAVLDLDVHRHVALVVDVGLDLDAQGDVLALDRLQRDQAAAAAGAAEGQGALGGHVAADLDRGLLVVGRVHVRLGHDVDVGAALQGLDDGAEAGDVAAGAEQLAGAGDERADEAAGEALEGVRGEHQRVEGRARGAADERDARAGRGIEGRAEVGAGADVGGVLDADLQHVDLDVELAPLHVELVDHGLQILEVGGRGDDDERAGRLVGGDLDVAREQVGGDRTGGGLVLVAAGLGGLLGAGGQGGEHGRDLLGVGVLELADVDATAAAGQLDVEALDEATDDDVVGLVGDDDEGAGALVDDDAVDRRRGRRAGAAALLGRGRGFTLACPRRRCRG